MRQGGGGGASFSAWFYSTVHCRNLIRTNSYIGQCWQTLIIGTNDHFSFLSPSLVGFLQWSRLSLEKGNCHKYTFTEQFSESQLGSGTSFRVTGRFLNAVATSLRRVILGGFFKIRKWHLIFRNKRQKYFLNHPRIYRKYLSNLIDHKKYSYCGTVQMKI